MKGKRPAQAANHGQLSEANRFGTGPRAAVLKLVFAQESPGELLKPRPLGPNPRVFG